jgi:hypothetical protein
VTGIFTRAPRGCWTGCCTARNCDGVHHVDSAGRSWRQPPGTEYCVPCGGYVICGHPAMLGSLPIHQQNLAAQDGELTRCGLFTAGLGGRVAGAGTDVTCSDCLDEGPAAAYVILPGGQVVERRSAALAGYPFAVAVMREEAWRLRYWADSADEARFLAVYANGEVAPVLFADTSRAAAMALPAQRKRRKAHP